MDTSTYIGVCGAGAMGAGIAQVAATAGHSIIVFDRDEAALSRGKASLEKGAKALLSRGKISEDEATAIESRVTWTTDLTTLAPCGLVIEAIIERADIKIELFESLAKTLKPSATIASNTSSLSITDLAKNLTRPSHFIGLHFFNPAPIMKLVEVVSGNETDPDRAKEALNLMQAWGKVAVTVKDVPGFIVNRIARPFYAEGWHAFENKIADAVTIDHLYRALAGFKMGPLELGDLIGHDINNAAARSIYDAYEGKTRFRPSALQASYVEKGTLGRKTGEGVYTYGENAPSPQLVTIDPATNSNDHMQEENAYLMSFLTNKNAPEEDAFILFEDVLIGYSNGKTAATLKKDFKHPVLVLDWMKNPKETDYIAVAASCETAKKVLPNLATALRKKIILIEDQSGMIVLRTLLQLLNAAMDGLADTIAPKEDIDLAMQNGANYPFGPIAWGQGYGLDTAITALTNIMEETKDPLYKPSDALLDMAN